MLRETWFWEVEVVRVEADAPAGRPWRLDFSLRPLTYLLSAVLASEAALVAFLYTAPPEEQVVLYDGGFCGCGTPYDPEAVYRNPPPRPPNSTFLVRRLP